MAIIKFHGTPVQTNGNIAKNGEIAPDFILVKTDLNRTSLHDYKGMKLVLNIFPSVDTGVCATSVRTFNQKASNLPNTKVLCISRDLPFASKRFCGAEGINNVEMLSDFDGGNFGRLYQLSMEDGPLKGLLARAVIVIDEMGKIIYSELVDELTHEPNYSAAFAVL
jgi:thiol peroxidase